MTETEHAVRKFIADEIVMDIDARALEPDESLLAGGLVDSMGLQRLVVYLEEQFDIAVGNDQLVPENFETIRSIARLVESLRPGTRTSP